MGEDDEADGGTSASPSPGRSVVITLHTSRHSARAREFCLPRIWTCPDVDKARGVTAAGRVVEGEDGAENTRCRRSACRVTVSWGVNEAMWR